MPTIPSDLDIAQSASIQPIAAIADKLGIDSRYLIPYGNDKAKVHLDVLKDVSSRPRGKYIDVTAITPTPLGEGKTTTTVGLVQGLGKLGHNAIAAIRQPSLGPTFGIKGGAAGGGYSQIVPMEDFNLHLTGDNHAVGIAHNLAAAAVDARWYHEAQSGDETLESRGLNRLAIDPYSIQWRRVADVNDRALRKVMVGLGGKPDGKPREAGFDITVASELMAILALADGDDYTSALADLRSRVGRIVVAFTKQGKPVTLDDVEVAGAVTVLMKDTLHPNLMQTLEGQAAFVHAGPFGNIAHGNSSILADRLALHVGDYVVTESGFGSEMGMEKFFNIKCRASGLIPDAVVLVATVRALKMHGGGPRVAPGRALDPAYTEESLELVEKGLPNLVAHIRNAHNYGIPVVVAINAFTHDTPREIEMIEEAALKAGAVAAHHTTHWADGGEGAKALAEAVVAAAEQPSNFSFLYPLEIPIKNKIETIAKDMYGASDVKYDGLAERQIDTFEKDGWGDLPICMAKTHLSLGQDPSVKGAPTGHSVRVSEVRASVGAGFIYPLLGSMRTMPGLGLTPAYMNVDIDEDGKVVGLF
jgi:methylenetetrahydrofolate dehydrogenase (NADP+)/methenyltetrahydrofolate cyclohydrolase/formyltetrahydrofolate synthetase/formate--tetrahydrofolate ligase